MRPRTGLGAGRSVRRFRCLGLVAALLLTSPEEGRAEPGDAPASAEVVEREQGGRASVKLPAPRQTGRIPLEEALARRRSVRELAPTPLRDVEHGQLLWAAQGITDRARGYRTAPSAGALYPLEIYLVTHAGVFRYEPRMHALEPISSRDVRGTLCEAALGQEMVRDAPAVFVLVGVYARTARKYGEARAERYVQLEAGHAAQNLLLEAVALDLAAVPVGAFDDDAVRRGLGLPASDQPLYLIPVGHPAP